MYDLRFVAKGLQLKPKPMSGSHVPSRPYLSFQDFTPEEIPDMDVSAELGLLACGKPLVPTLFLASVRGGITTSASLFFVLTKYSRSSIA